MRFTINELSMHIQCIKCSHTKSTLCDSPLFDKADKNRKRFWFGEETTYTYTYTADTRETGAKREKHTDRERERVSERAVI